MTPQSLWHEFSGELEEFLRRQVANSADAEDLHRQVFLAINQHLTDHEPPDHARSWVYQIARNAIVDHHRRRGSRPDVEWTAPLHEAADTAFGGRAGRGRGRRLGPLPPRHAGSAAGTVSDARSARHGGRAWTSRSGSVLELIGG